MTGAERVLRVLSDGRPHSHSELYALGVIAHSRISDLRHRGHTIECWRDGDQHYYQLVSPVGGPANPGVNHSSGSRNRTGDVGPLTDHTGFASVAPLAVVAAGKDANTAGEDEVNPDIPRSSSSPAQLSLLGSGV